MPGYGPGMMENMGGSDPSDLMARPEIRQEETRNGKPIWLELHMSKRRGWQHEKTNPMNAMSQNPGKVFLMNVI